MLRQYQRVHGGSYRTLDNRQDQEAAIADPVAFAAEGEPPRLIDEVHLGGDWLVCAIKIAVDEDPRPGRFILSGSSRFLTVPTLSESLAGRAAFVDLRPLSMAEITRGPADFLSRASHTWTRCSLRPRYRTGRRNLTSRLSKTPEVFLADSGLATHLLGERFAAGVVLHLGQRASSFGDGIHALPVSSLWGHAQA